MFCGSCTVFTAGDLELAFNFDQPLLTPQAAVITGQRTICPDGKE